MKTKIAFLLFALISTTVIAQVVTPVPVDKGTKQISVTTKTIMTSVALNFKANPATITAYFETHYYDQDGNDIGSPVSSYVQKSLTGIVAEKAQVQPAIDTLASYLNSANSDSSGK